MIELANWFTALWQDEMWWRSDFVSAIGITAFLLSIIFAIFFWKDNK